MTLPMYRYIHTLRKDRLCVGGVWRYLYYRKTRVVDNQSHVGVVCGFFETFVASHRVIASVFW